jgi:hypothetical protein
MTSEFELDSNGEVILKPLAGWKIKSVAGIGVLLMLHYAETPLELETGDSGPTVLDASAVPRACRGAEKMGHGPTSGEASSWKTSNVIRLPTLMAETTKCPYCGFENEPIARTCAKEDRGQSLCGRYLKSELECLRSMDVSLRTIKGVAITWLVLFILAFVVSFLYATGALR